jgi:hypothetical protein
MMFMHVLIELFAYINRFVIERKGIGFAVPSAQHSP